MQQSKIEWTDYVWNPVTGCMHGCPYCYARKMANRLKGRYGYPEVEPFKPTFHEERFKDFHWYRNQYNGKKIFVSSMGDLFGNWVPDEWINAVIRIAGEHPFVTFIFLTKNPKRYNSFMFPKNIWLGYSTTGSLYHEWSYMHKNNIKFVSIEPMMGEMVNTAYLHDTNWVIIGAETGNRKGKVKIENQWLYDALIILDKQKIPVFIKDNAGAARQDFPVDAHESVTNV